MTCKDEDIGKLIGSYELGFLSEDEKQRFEGHLLDCEYCFQSLYRTAPLASLIREKRLAPEENIEFADEEEEESLPEPPSKNRLAQLFRRPWVYAAAGLSVVLIVALIVILFQGPGKEVERLRGFDEVSILVISPVGEVSALNELKWKAITGIEFYEVSIHTETGDLVWKETLQGSVANLPESISEALIPGGSYRWQVRAQTDRGEQLKSESIQFRIRY
jgi:hypothetical protein